MVKALALIDITPIETSPPLALTVGRATTKAQPGGGARVKEPLGVEKSPDAPSAIVIVPRVVGDVATVLQMLVPPEPGVTVTFANPAKLMQEKSIISAIFVTLTRLLLLQIVFTNDSKEYFFIR